MDVLVLAHRAPVAPITGANVKVYHVLRAMLERGIRPHLRCFGTPDEGRRLSESFDGDSIGSIEVVGHDPLSIVPRVGMAFLRGSSLTDAMFDSRQMRSSVAEAVKRHGIRRAFAYSSSMAQFVPVELRARTFMELADLDSQKFSAYAKERPAPMRWVHAIEGRRQAERERTIIEQFGRCSLVSAREIALLRRQLPDLHPDRVMLLRNGVDTAYFAACEARESGDRDRVAAEAEFIFTGVMDYPPNVQAVGWFATQVLPGLRTRVPGARFTVVGTRPSAQVRRLGTLPGVVVTGAVDDVRPYLARATACVVPLTTARGVQNKAIEAMACGKAVVCSPAVHEGVGARPGVDYLVADAAAQWVEVLACVADDCALRSGLGGSARGWVVDNHDWARCLSPLFEFLEGPVAKVCPGNGAADEPLVFQMDD